MAHRTAQGALPSRIHFCSALLSAGRAPCQRPREAALCYSLGLNMQHSYMNSGIETREAVFYIQMNDQDYMTIELQTEGRNDKHV